MNLSPAALEWAIRSIEKRADTDLFPRPIELRVLALNIPASLRELETVDISSHQPVAPRRFIVPKDDLSYRAATQLDPLDSLILTALMYTYGSQIEARRRPIAEKSVFSYRFSLSDTGELYASSNAWNAFWSHCFEVSKQYKTVLVADIADFYNQIYHHTIQNQLNEAGWPNQATKWVLRLLETISAKVSRGIPVGPHASHLLAEASLIPVDNSLAARGLTFCRFVDDIVIFAEDDTGARTALLQLAEILDKQQRLHLQNGKTRVLPRNAFQELCRDMIEDRPINDLEAHLLKIIQKYSEGNPYATVLLSELSDEELKAFSPDIIEKILKGYVDSQPPDFVRLRWFLRRITQVGHPSAIEYCLRQFERLTPATSDICQYLLAVAASDSVAEFKWDSIGARILQLLESPLISANEYFQLSLLSLFSRVLQLDHVPSLLNRYKSSSPALRREIILVAAETEQGDWLRELKEDITAMDPWSRRALVYAARCLPAEERKFFLRYVPVDSQLIRCLITRAKQ
jgi:Reverse transcriptase (RNA-dependent DNA polymerase)